MPITILPASPSRSDPSTFSTKADGFLGALPTFVTEANALEANINLKESQYIAAANSAAIAQAAANFKGAWSALTGAAAIPYSVSHLGRYWMLITATSNIATDVPGTSAKWQEIGNVALQDFQVAVNPKAIGQAVSLTAAVSGSSGIFLANNANINNGLNNFAWIWKGSLLDWTEITCLFINKNQSATDRIYIQHNTNKKFYYVHQKTGFPIVTGFGTVTHTTPNGSAAEFVFAVTRESASVAGSVLIYCNGLLLDTLVIPAGTPIDITNTGVFSLMAYNGSRYAGTLIHSYILNFAPTAAEVLDMYRNEVPLKWFDPTGVSPASQTAQTSGLLVIGKEYIIDAWISDDNFVNVGGANVNGTRFVATGTTPTKWLASSVLRRIGATLMIEGEGMQPAPGQCLDSSGNKLHAMQPTTGSSLTRLKKQGEIRWENTWAGTHEAQYVGGINQNVLPPDNIRIDSITMVVVGATGNVILGDGSATDKFVASVALAAYLDCTVASRNHDGTNRKLVINPDTNLTGSINTILKYTIL